MNRQFAKTGLAQSVVDSAMKKYPLTPSNDREQSINNMRVLSWRFDSQEDRLFPPTNADFERGCFGLPSAVSPRNGVGLDVCIDRPWAPTIQQINRELAARYSATLFRESDLTKFRSANRCRYGEVQRKARGNENEKAKQSVRQILIDPKGRVLQVWIFRPGIARTQAPKLRGRRVPPVPRFGDRGQYKPKARNEPPSRSYSVTSVRASTGSRKLSAFCSSSGSQFLG